MVLLLGLTTQSLAAENDNKTTSTNSTVSTYKQTESVWLTDKSGKFLTLQREYLSATLNGVILLVSDIATPPNNPHDIEPLRRSLNTVGWTTVSITAPPFGSDEETTKDSASTSINTLYAAALVKRIKATIKSVSSISENIVLVVQGRQVAYLTHAIAQEKLVELTAVIFIEASVAYAVAQSVSDDKELEQPIHLPALAQSISILKLPVLDIYRDVDALSKKNMRLRKQLSLRNQQLNYRQIHLYTRLNSGYLFESIYGWLRSIGLN
ncbi:MAG: DUF3530 family protein [Psychrobium sp.]|nr:DUF3530 family protein [Psychrobium sp.]